MANDEHLKILKKGVLDWNKWRSRNLDKKPNLSKADLSRANLREANLSNVDLFEVSFNRTNLRQAKLVGADLSRADLREADLFRANLSDAILFRANLSKANLLDANLIRVDLSRSNLFGVNFSRANLRKANLSGANLNEAILVETILENTNISDCRIYGISAWNLRRNKETRQSNLIITPETEPTITVDNLEVAQFIYLLLNNEKIRDIIDTINSKVVLILGRFTSKRKAVLEAIREKMREYDYSPVLFDFDKPRSRDFIETVSILAHLARFIIADFTDAKIVLEEVPHIVRNITVPVKPILLQGSGREPVTLNNLRGNHRTLLSTFWYKDSKDLLCSIKREVIDPAEEKVKEI